MKKAAGYLLIALAGIAALAAQKGTVPRGNASRYPAHVQRDAGAAGAMLLTPEQVRRAFSTDVGRCCVVIEVAIYPREGKAADISQSDFVLRLAGSDVAARPSSPKLIAAMLQKAASGDREIDVHPSVGVGYESGRGYDPMTGERRGGWRTSAGVGVGVGDSRPAASTGRDREVMELELSEKGLPEGSASAPVSGYLYFPLALKKRPSAFTLEYTGLGEKVLLRLP